MQFSDKEIEIIHQYRSLHNDVIEIKKQIQEIQSSDKDDNFKIFQLCYLQKQLELIEYSKNKLQYTEHLLFSKDI